MKLEYLTATQLGHKVNSHEITPTQVVDYFLKRIEEKNPEINAMVYVKPEEAYARAAELEVRLNQGKYCGPFAGVPFALKDFLPSKKGWTNTHGGVKSLTAIDDSDSEFCRAMEAAGGIALGKTNAPAFGFRGTTDNKLYGPTRNPFDTRYNSGGSSGGSAAAVAAGLVLIAEGGDAGGSIRVPAAWCGCYGFKATFGSIPNVNRPDAWSATHPYCTPGGLCKSVEDAAILMEYMSYYDENDPLSSCHDRPTYSYEIMNHVGILAEGLNIGYTYDFGLFEVDSEVKHNMDVFINELNLLGFDPQEVKFNFKYDLKQLSDAWCTGICIDSTIEQILHPSAIDKKDLPEEFIKWTDITSKVDIMDYYKFHIIRTDVYDQIQKVFDAEDYDILICPVTNCLPVLNKPGGDTKGPDSINGVPCDALIGFAQTFLFNMTGNPAASLPFGFSKEGLPIGVQVVGRRYYGDLDVLAFSRYIEKEYPWKDTYKY